jgi:putative glutathione S-transferase
MWVQVMIARALRGLTTVISLSHLSIATQGKRGTDSYVGWGVPPGDPLGFASAFEIYNSQNPGYGRQQLTIPILFDKVQRVVVSNDPAQILLMLESSFQGLEEPGVASRVPIYGHIRGEGASRSPG